MYKLLTDEYDATPQYYDTDTGAIVTVVDPTSLMQACYEGRKTDGFSPGHKWRRVAHIEMDTVKLLAKMGDSDAHDYLYFDDPQARDRMIRRRPEIFKACSGSF